LTPVVLLTAAQKDLRRAAEFYAGEARQIASHFLAQFEHTLELISGDPELGAVTGRGARRLVMRRFPYTIIYRVEAGRVVVLAVGHQRRNPEFWLGRA
jgi:toxin ParE1/3/4